MKLKLNLKTWNQWRLQTEAEIRDLKFEMRRSNFNPSWDMYRDLKKLKHTATRIYMIRAEARNHLHCTVREIVKPGPDGSTIRELIPVTREDQRGEVQAYLPTPFATPDADNNIGLCWRVIPEMNLSSEISQGV